MTTVVQHSNLIPSAFDFYHPSQFASAPNASRKEGMNPHYYGAPAPTTTVSENPRPTPTGPFTFNAGTSQQSYVALANASSPTFPTSIAPRAPPLFPSSPTSQTSLRQVPAFPQTGSPETVTRSSFRASASSFPPSTPQDQLAFTGSHSHGSTTDSSSRPDHRVGPSNLESPSAPRAARAGPDGKDRRPIDPPPILQLMMQDFDPDNPADVEEIKSQWWVVHCKLVAAETPSQDLTTMHFFRDDGRREVQRLLLGTTVASPTVTMDDPDPDTMPQHPRSPAAPPSPTIDRFIPRSAASATGKARPPHLIPGTFFIFADLSVRRAGDYRLQFTLMKMDAEYLSQGSTVPCIDTTISVPFRVVNAKDFDQVQPSTNLVKGLLQRGAGFPLKLKKGNREGQRRRRHTSGGDSEDSDDDDDY
ncbi:hypothetical protein LTS17_003840 [Exophiala oligosperma]